MYIYIMYLCIYIYIYVCIYRLYIYIYIIYISLPVRLFEETRISTNLNYTSIYAWYIRQLVVDKKVSKICSWIHIFATICIFLQLIVCLYLCISYMCACMHARACVRAGVFLSESMIVNGVCIRLFHTVNVYLPMSS